MHKEGFRSINRCGFRSLGLPQMHVHSLSRTHLTL